MAKYRKKPVVIEAVKWLGYNLSEIKDFAGDNVALDKRTNELFVQTLEDGLNGQAKHVATVGDFIIKGVHGEFYFCKPDIFDKTYELCEE